MSLRERLHLERVAVCQCRDRSVVIRSEEAYAHLRVPGDHLGVGLPEWISFAGGDDGNLWPDRVEK